MNLGKIQLLLFFSLLITSCGQNYGFDSSKLKEPSGIYYQAPQMYISSDDGYMSIINFGSGKVILKKYIGGLDLEGVASDENLENIYAIDESSSRIIEINKENLEVIQIINLKNPVLGKGRDGFEGIAFKEEKEGFLYFFVTHQTSPAFLGLAKVDRINGEWELIDKFEYSKWNDLSEVYFDQDIRSLFVIDDKSNRMYELKWELENKAEILKEYVIKGNEQEGLTKVDGTFYYSSDKGGVFKLEYKEVIKK